MRRSSGSAKFLFRSYKHCAPNGVFFDEGGEPASLAAAGFSAALSATSDLIGLAAGRDSLIGIRPCHAGDWRSRIVDSRHRGLGSFDVGLLFWLSRARLMQFIRKVIFRLLKLLQSLTHSARQLRQFLSAKEQQDQEKNENPLRTLEYIQDAREKIHMLM